MSDEIKVGARRVWRSATARAIEIVEQLTEEPFAGEFRYRYVDNDETGILPAESLEMSTRPAPTNPSDGAVTSTPAPSDDTKAAIVEAALHWYAIRNDHSAEVSPLQLFDADDALNMAVKAHITAATS